MKLVAQYLAQRHRRSKAGRTGAAARDLIVVCKDLLESIDCRHGPERQAAIRELEYLQSLGLVELERHRRDPAAILKVRLRHEQAEALFAQLGETGPQEEREVLARLFREAGRHSVSEQFSSGWETFCADFADAALAGNSVQPFDRASLNQTREILSALPRILAWEGESLRRFASSLLFDDSKRLEILQPRIDSCLARITEGTASTLADFGILPNDRGFLLHGPLTLYFPDGSLSIGLLRQPVRLSAADMRRATIRPQALRCLTVENSAMLYELAKLQSDTLLVSSGSEGGFANSAVIDFLRALPPELELWHFGDSDPKGFEILADLRIRSGREIHSLHMQFRPPDATPAYLTTGDEKAIDRLLSSESLTLEEKDQIRQMRASGTKGRFEQEALGHPGAEWPHY